MADLLQFKRKTSATIQQTFRSGTTPTDLDSGVPTVVITKPDLTTIASGAVTHVGAAGSGTYQFVLAGQAECTVLDVAWTGTIGGQPQTLENTVEIIGADLFTITDLRALRVAGSTPFADASTYPDTKIHEHRAATLDEFEQILGFSPVPRFARETVDGDGWSGTVVLPHRRCQPNRLLSVTVNGEVKSVSGYTLRPSGILEMTSSYVRSGVFPAGSRNVTAEYIHGWTRVEGDGRDMAMLRASMKLLPGVSSTASTVVTPDGAAYTYDRAGSRNAAGEKVYFGVGAIAEWLNEHQLPSAVA